HGGFGLLTIQGINKPAFYAYQFLNKLGNTELVNKDARSWVTKNSRGDMQLLLWDFTYTLPDSTNNQNYYIKDLPAKAKGKVKFNFTNVPAGKYKMEIYKVGYRENDAYTSYLDMGKPARLNKQQVEKLKSKNNGAPVVREIISVKNNFSKELELRENDVLFINLIKQ
ncbi:MAG: glycoside hydrolase, partial [Chitinophagaceae bacterium]